MYDELCFATITDDHGMASELVHVSPIFTRCGPSRRGRYADRREARTWRTDARHARRQGAESAAQSGARRGEIEPSAPDAGSGDGRGRLC